jgi:hypothetical protein
LLIICVGRCPFSYFKNISDLVGSRVSPVRPVSRRGRHLRGEPDAVVGASAAVCSVRPLALHDCVPHQRPSAVYGRWLSPVGGWALTEASQTLHGTARAVDGMRENIWVPCSVGQGFSHLWGEGEGAVVSTCMQLRDGWSQGFSHTHGPTPLHRGAPSWAHRRLDLR